METFFKKYFWTAQAGFVLVAALLLAGTINGFLAGFASPFSVAFPSTPPPTADEPTDREVPQLDTRLLPPPPPVVPTDPCAGVQCAEDQICNAVTGQCEAVAVAPPPAPTDGRCIESDIAINLVGTMVADEAEWSLAILRNPALNQTQFARVGSTLLTEARVTSIERTRIFLERNGRVECLRPGDASQRAQRATPGASPAALLGGAVNAAGALGGPPSAAPAVDAAAPPPTPVAGQTLQERIANEVRRTSDTSFEVTRDLVQHVANNQQLMEQNAPRIVPNYVNGQPRGFRLQGIPAGSLFASIGINNGDVIVGVDGTPIDSPQRALELYQAMLQRDRVSLQVERRGRERTIEYTIR